MKQRNSKQFLVHSLRLVGGTIGEKILYQSPVFVFTVELFFVTSKTSIETVVFPKKKIGKLLRSLNCNEVCSGLHGRAAVGLK